MCAPHCGHSEPKRNKEMKALLLGFSIPVETDDSKWTKKERMRSKTIVVILSSVAEEASEIACDLTTSSS